MINERARLQYLEAMGIQTYMPRVQLPAAPAAIAVDLSFLPASLERELAASPAGNSPVATPPPAATSERSGGMQSGGALLESLLPTQPGKSTSAPKVIPKAETPAPAPEKLNVALWQAADLLVLADRHPEQALPVNRMLANILQALGRKADTQKPEILRWPLENVSAQLAGPAKDYFLSILQARRPAGQSPTLLCFGEAVSQCLSVDPEAADNRVPEALTLPNGDALPVIFLPALDHLILQPDAKPAVWAAIKSLRI